jgi:hypothetical protein
MQVSLDVPSKLLTEISRPKLAVRTRVIEELGHGVVWRARVAVAVPQSRAQITARAQGKRATGLCARGLTRELKHRPALRPVAHTRRLVRECAACRGGEHKDDRVGGRTRCTCGGRATARFPCQRASRQPRARSRYGRIALASDVASARTASTTVIREAGPSTRAPPRPSPTMTDGQRSQAGNARGKPRPNRWQCVFGRTCRRRRSC